MKRCLLRFAVCCVALNLYARPMWSADEPSGASPPSAASVGHNAAVIYWQAFAALRLTEAQEKEIPAAVKALESHVPNDLRASLAGFQASLHELHRAYPVRECDWELEYAAGPMLRLPHLNHVRELSYVALLRARTRFADGETDAAVTDVLAVMKMARDCGRSPVLIPMLMDIAMEKMATDVLAANLSQLDPAQLNQLTTSLQELPPSASLAEGLRQESDMFGGWVGRRIEQEAAKINDLKAGAQILGVIQAEGLLGDDLTMGTDADAKRRRELVQSLTLEELRSAVHRLHSDYEEVAKIAELQYAERGPKFAAFQAGLDQSRKLANRDDLVRSLSIQFLPSYQMVSLRMKELHVRRSLLDLAIQVQLHGPDVLKTAPIHGATVEHHQTDAGFELRYQIPGADKTESLKVPAKK